jgi:Xaa-Pro aminopeptidase
MNNSINSRKRLADKIKNGAVLLHSGSIVYRNNDTWYPFRQDSNFYYLTEWPEPDAHAVILIKDSEPELHLFVQDRNEEMETWEGKRLGQSGAVDEYRCFKSLFISRLRKNTSKLVKRF